MSTAHPTISIVTPSFNQAIYIEETLHSVAGQRYPNIEHIVIDGGSSDGTLAILDRYSSTPGWEHLRWISEKDHGQTDALNKGFKLASGEIIGWLNSDDLYESGCLATVSEAFQRHPEADFVYGDYVIVDEKSERLISKKEIDFDWEIMLCGLNYIAQPNVFFRRAVFGQVGYLNDSLHYVMDYEFWLRAATNGLRFQRLPETLAACRWHMDAKTVSRNPRIDEELKSVRDQYWNKRRFHNRSLQTTYQACCKLRARAFRQWKKLCSRNTMDILPASWYLQLWKMRKSHAS